MIPFPFSASSTPGLRPGEGEGRIINGFWAKEGGNLYCRRSRGLVSQGEGLTSSPRAIFEVNGTLYVVNGGNVRNIGGGTTLSGASITGTDPVTVARNNKTQGGLPAPDVVITRRDGGSFAVNPGGGTVAAYPDADLPATANSVSFLDAYFLWTIPDGRIFASDLNSTVVNALSFATAEARPDGLIRGAAKSGKFYAFGSSSIEVWLNVGSSPFPLQRAPTVIPLGLYAFGALGGMDDGWAGPLIFVASDCTVRTLTGYETQKVSTPDVEAFIQRSTPSTFETVIYTTAGHAFWALSSDQGTWELNVSTGQWNERVSGELNRWRVTGSTKATAGWVFGDTQSSTVFRLDENGVTEGGAAVTWTVESAPLKKFPVKARIPGVYADFTEAPGADVLISWSHDGGKTFATPQARSLDAAERYPVSVNRAGLSTHHGMRLRLVSQATVDFTFMGASVPLPEPGAP